MTITCVAFSYTGIRGYALTVRKVHEQERRNENKDRKTRRVSDRKGQEREGVRQRQRGGRRGKKRSRKCVHLVHSSLITDSVAQTGNTSSCSDSLASVPLTHTCMGS